MAEKKKVSLFFMDVDGTLTGKGGSLIHDENGLPSLKAAEFLLKLASSGFKPVIVSSRNRKQLYELSRFLGGVDFVAEMGRAIFFWGKEKPVHLTRIPKTENPYLMFLNGTLSRLLKEHDGYLEPHYPWWKNSRTTLLLRGCLKSGSKYLLEKVNEDLARKGMQFLKLVENGKTGRKGNLRCKQARIYHLSHLKISKLAGVKRYIEITEKDFEIEKVVAAGDSTSDLEMSAVSDRFFFVGSEADFKVCLELLKYQNQQAHGKLASVNLVVCETRSDFFEKAMEEV